MFICFFGRVRLLFRDIPFTVVKFNSKNTHFHVQKLNVFPIELLLGNAAGRNKEPVIEVVPWCPRVV